MYGEGVSVSYLQHGVTQRRPHLLHVSHVHVAVLVGAVVGSTKGGLEGEAHRDVKLAGNHHAGSGFSSFATMHEVNEVKEMHNRNERNDTINEIKEMK